MTAASAKRASRATVQAVRHGPAPSVSAVRRTRGSTPCTAAADKAAAIGRASSTSPTTIACQVYSQPRPPSGPRRQEVPEGQSDRTGDDGRDDGNFEREERDSENFGITGDQQPPRAPHSLG